MPKKDVSQRAILIQNAAKKRMMDRAGYVPPKKPRPKLTTNSKQRPV